MKLVNISSRIIGVAGTVLMPDAELPCSEAITELPAIKAFVAGGLLRVEKDSAKETKAEAKTADKTADEAKKKTEAETKTTKASK